jgi:hypothetical protein
MRQPDAEAAVRCDVGIGPRDERRRPGCERRPWAGAAASGPESGGRTRAGGGHTRAQFGPDYLDPKLDL